MAKYMATVKLIGLYRVVVDATCESDAAMQIEDMSASEVQKHQHLWTVLDTGDEYPEAL